MKRDLNSFLHQAERVPEKNDEVQNDLEQRLDEPLESAEPDIVAETEVFGLLDENEVILDLEQASTTTAAEASTWQVYPEVPVDMGDEWEALWLDTPVSAELVGEDLSADKSTSGVGMTGVLAGLAVAGLVGGVAAASGGKGGSSHASTEEVSVRTADNEVVNVVDTSVQTEVMPSEEKTTVSQEQPTATAQETKTTETMPSEEQSQTSNTQTSNQTPSENQATKPSSVTETKPAVSENTSSSSEETKTTSKPAEENKTTETVTTEKPAQTTEPTVTPATNEQKQADDTTVTTDNTDSNNTTPTVTEDASAGTAPVGRIGNYGDYHIYYSPKYGDYINVAEFGADPTGKTDSLAAIKSALAIASKERAMVYMEGTFYISDQIVINDETAGVRGIFGAGMGETVIQFDKAQVGVFNPNSNNDDIRAYAGILIDGQSNKTIASLSVEYTNDDFYREGLSYFGKVTDILVNDADNTLIDSVEASGANRAGVFFTSTDALTKESGASKSYKDRLINNEIDEQYDTLPLGENNRIVNSNLHNNRVAGALFAYQKDFVAENNLLAWNGHEADGGTGYGIAAMAGSYNYGVTFRGNTTDHNYRKGLDIHDGTDIVIENNTLNGDRLYGIAVYNRQFTMDNVVITGNKITQDPDFRLENDDDLGASYRLYSAIQLQTNTQFRDLHSADTGYFEISNNIIENLQVYGRSAQQYGIEFRNHEQQMDYVLNITGNQISGDSTKYLIAVINDTQDRNTGELGIGSGTINISNNTADIGTIEYGAVPIYVEEKNSKDLPLHGTVTVDNNDVTIRTAPNGYAEFTYLRGNATEYDVTNNTMNLHGRLNDGLIEIHGSGNGVSSDINVAQNVMVTDIKGALYKTWLRYDEGADVYAAANTHNDNELATVNTSGEDVSLNDVLANVNQLVTAANEAAYHTQGSILSIENNQITTGIL